MFNRRGHREVTEASSMRARLKELRPGFDYRYAFNQRTGDFTIYNADGSVELIQYGGMGYSWSGRGEHVNDPSANYSVGKGPTPRGLWHVAADTPFVFKGMPHSMRLVPIGGLNTVFAGFRDPGSFLIHGGSGPNSSEGCMVLPADVRRIVVGTGPGRLYVH
jgi:hypothetical protein